MKILFITKPDSIYAWLAEQITEHTDHEAFSCDVKTQSPVSDPDIVLCIGTGWLTFEQEAKMGLVKNPDRKKGLYIIGAPVGRGGVFEPSGKRWFHHDFWATQCIDDKYFLKSKKIETPHWANEEVSLWDDSTDFWLPQPINTDLPKAIVTTDELNVAIALGWEAQNGAWDKGLRLLHNAYSEIGFKLNLIEGVSKEEALARKADSNLIWDSCFGNIGRSGLESLAQGIPVIARLSPDVVACFEELGAGFPVVTWLTIEELHAKLQHFKENPEELDDLADTSYDWAQTFYTPEKIANYWVTAFEKVLLRK